MASCSSNNTPWECCTPIVWRYETKKWKTCLCTPSSHQMRSGWPCRSSMTQLAPERADVWYGILLYRCVVNDTTAAMVALRIRPAICKMNPCLWAWSMGCGKRKVIRKIRNINIIRIEVTVTSQSGGVTVFQFRPPNFGWHLWDQTWFLVTEQPLTAVLSEENLNPH